MDSHLTTYILKVFTKHLGIADYHLDTAGFFVVVVVSLVSVVVVLGLINTISIVDVGLESV